MGDPKRTKKHYETPKKPYDKERLDAEREIMQKYGLKSKRELWRAETILRKKRENARKLLALPLEERVKRERELIGSLARLGLLTEKSTLDDVLTLTTEHLLERRLQTMTLRKGLANTATQARQFIVHGHIAINGQKIDSPSYLVTVDEEKKIGYYGKKMDIAAKAVEAKEELKKEFEKAKPEEAGEKKKEERAAEDKEKESEEKVKAEAVAEEKKEKQEKKEQKKEKEQEPNEKKKQEVKADAN